MKGRRFFKWMLMFVLSVGIFLGFSGSVFATYISFQTKELKQLIGNDFLDHNAVTFIIVSGWWLDHVEDLYNVAPIVTAGGGWPSWRGDWPHGPSSWIMGVYETVCASNGWPFQVISNNCQRSSESVLF